MIRNLSLDAFKQATGIRSFEIVQNPNTKKWFAAGDNGEYFKVHQATDWKTKPEVVVLVEDCDLTKACIIPKSLLPSEAVATY